ncbi:MAG: hypothetical protein EHM24_19385 [Acidobacteria bacterium]|nr:MAG: hypothetical protein EHM24_19385 [Acidobacteriota bacterium]
MTWLVETAPVSGSIRRPALMAVSFSGAGAGAGGCAAATGTGVAARGAGAGGWAAAVAANTTIAVDVRTRVSMRCTPWAGLSYACRAGVVKRGNRGVE